MNQPSRQLGVLPALLPAYVAVAGGAIEGLHAWWDPDFYRKLALEGDLDQQVARLNNDWHNLERSLRASRFVYGQDPILGKVYRDMSLWWTWKTEFSDAELRRALQWMPGTGGRDWELEYNNFQRLFESDHEEALKLAAARYQEEALRAEIEGRGTAPDLRPQPREPLLEQIREGAGQALEQASDAASAAQRQALFWPVVAVVGTGVVMFALTRAGGK